MCILLFVCRCDGIGRRSGLKIHRQRWRAGSSPATGTINYCHGDYNSVLRSQGSTYLTKGNRPDLTIWTVFFYAFSTCQQRLTVLK